MGLFVCDEFSRLPGNIEGNQPRLSNHISIALNTVKLEAKKKYRTEQMFTEQQLKKPGI